MRGLTCVASYLLFTFAVFGQSDRGTITGTITDPVSAVVPNAMVSAKNIENGSLYETATTATGAYTLASLPAGTYELSVEVPGFKKFTQTGIGVQVAQSARIDVILQVGDSTESVTVSADAPLLKTESAEQSYNINTDRMNALPLNFGARGSGSVRNPYTFVVLTPGGNISGASTIRINGAPNNSFGVRVEGQEANNSLQPGRPDEQQPSLEAVQEISVQTSNFSAEYGQVAGGLFNFTTKSGTNRFHGSAYEYFTNEALNAGRPYTDNGRGSLIRQVTRKQDFGVSWGGPVYIPKVYNGRDKTFFFFNYEQYYERRINTASSATLPTLAMRGGNFSGVLTGRSLGTDSLGRPILENTIYDPATTRVVNGQTVRDAFPGNIIPPSRFDPVAAKIQAMIPNPDNALLVNNWLQSYPVRREINVPSIKVDHSFSAKAKISVFYSNYRTDLKGEVADGLPIPITAARTNHMRTPTTRVNFDYTVTPTLLIHAGAGYLKQYAPDAAVQEVVDYDVIGQLGLVGTAIGTGFPRITGLTSNFGGLSLGLGPTNINRYFQEKPTAVASATWVRNNHTYKLGAEFRIDAFTNRTKNGTTGTYNFSAAETCLPYLSTCSIGGGSIGFPYASFLLGLTDSATVASPQDPQWRKNSWSLFVQDNWKITRKLTLDYGLRWDYQGSLHEIHHRASMFGPMISNPSAGGLPGAILYEGYGEGRCNCDFTDTYPYAIGPRLGAAYQITPKMVLRAGWGLTYGTTAQYNFIGIQGVGFNQLSFGSPTFGEPALNFSNGLRYNPALLTQASLNPGLRPTPGQIDSPAYLIDRNGGRPSRISQWSIGLQREFGKDLVIEAAYVGNRGAWYQANGLNDLNALTPERIRSFGLDINNAADRTLLTSRLDSAAVQARGFRTPYAAFPTGQTLAQRLRPFPQYGTIPTQWSPLGNNWYDSLQVKATKRYSHGLDFSAAFTWSKELVRGAEAQNGGGPINDVFNRANQKNLSASSQPFVFVTAFTYIIPAPGNNKLVRAAVAGWTVGGLLRYSSGMPIQVPAAQNNLAQLLFRGTFANRVAGEPLFLKDLNCHCIDPNKDFVLNPKAWSDPPAGQWGTSAAYYSDYRSARRPDEQFSLGRTFKIREGITLQFRAEFFNVYNRTYMNNPDSTNALATQARNAAGAVVSGFGRINIASVANPARNGQLIGRFQW